MKLSPELRGGYIEVVAMPAIGYGDRHFPAETDLKNRDALRRSFFQKDGGRYLMAPPQSSQRTCLMPQLSEEFSLSSMPSTHLSQRLQ